jgi:hypothetical protein
MKTVLLSTAYLPPISWMASAIQCDLAEIDLHETYPKQTYRNRSVIAVSGGVLNLTVPVVRVDGNHTTTGNIAIDNSTNWQQQHWRSIISAYNKAPYFLYYRDQFEPLFRKKHMHLFRLNQDLLEILLKVLKVKKPELKFTERYDFSPVSMDLRNAFHPKTRQLQIDNYNKERYIQVFEETNGFIPDLSSIDLLFNLGPDALPYLEKYKIISQ